MANDIPWQMLERYFAKETDASENQEVTQWVASAAENTMIFEQLSLYYRSSGSLPVEFFPDTNVALEKISQKTINKSKTIRLSNLYWKVAAVLLIGFCGWWLIQGQIKKKIPAITTVLKTDTTVKNIILSDGSHIWLNSHSSIKYPEKEKHILK
jgi:transmembrane sensor